MNERLLDGYTWSKGETYEETNNLSSRQYMARYVEAKKKAKQRWAIEKTKLDNAIKMNILH